MHAHAPATQLVPPAQRFPHTPQFAGSVVGSTHVVLPPEVHAMRGAVHIVPHVPPLQTIPAAQETPHPPQFALSLCVFAQMPPQRMVPVAHAHVPL